MDLKRDIEIEFEDGEKELISIRKKKKISKKYLKKMEKKNFFYQEESEDISLLWNYTVGTSGYPIYTNSISADGEYIFVGSLDSSLSWASSLGTHPWCWETLLG